MCKGLIPESEIEMLKTSKAIEDFHYKGPGEETLKKLQAFEVALRNDLVKIRASRKHTDPLKYLRQGDFSELSLQHTAASAYRNPSPLEGEKILDLERWRKLEELAAGHYFDTDSLLIYAQKLLILERWERIHSGHASRLIEEVLEKS